MLTYVIFGVLLLGAVLILITHSYKPNTARSWVIAIVSASIAWVASFVLRLYLPADIPHDPGMPTTASLIRLPW